MTPHRRTLLNFTLGGGALLAVALFLWRKQAATTTSERPLEGSRAVALARPEAQPADRAPRSAAEASGETRDAQARVTVDRIRRLLDSLEPVMPGEVENKAAIDLLRWWAQIDPVPAMEFAATHLALHGRAALAAELFGSWSEGNRAAALKWAAGLPAGELRAQLLPAVIAVVAAQQPQEALRLADELSGENRRTALAALFAGWTSLEPAAAVREAQALRDAKEQNLALRVVIGKWMESDANAAIAWARNRPPDAAPDSVDVLPPVLGILVEKWATRAPADAGAFLIATPEGAGRLQLLRNVAEQWAGTNPREALTWAAQIADDGDRKMLVRGVLAAVAAKDVQAAAELALTLDGRSREHGLGMVLEQWMARDRAGMLAWASDLAQRQPHRAAEMAQSISNPALRQPIIDALGAAR